MVQKRPLPSREPSLELSYDTITRKGLQSLARTVSPPPAIKKRKAEANEVQKSATAAVEAGEKNVEDHLTFYSAHLLAALRPQIPGVPRLDHQEWVEMYRRNAGSGKGCHYVIHQHDHPIAGTHYDLRLQCNPTSSISFAIMYGLPGDPNSRRVNRNATETRVHCLWNHLIETASHSTGSMLIWDTGEFEVLPNRGEKEIGDSTVEASEGEHDRSKAKQTEQEKLRTAFQRRKIKLRMHGTKLPNGYTLALRLTKDNFRSEQPKKPSRRRRRQAPGGRQVRDSGSDVQESTAEERRPPRRGLSSLSRLSSPPASPRTKSDVTDEDAQADAAAAVASDDEDEAIRASNAYTGATNDIGSVHQRKWFLSVDRAQSGFIKNTTKSVSGFVETNWARKRAGADLAEGVIETATGFDRFVVGGREIERSVVTGRLASEILADEGVVGYVPRGLWRAITE